MNSETEFWDFYNISVRWGDMDAYGHVNNTFFFKYLESARIAYFEKMARELQQIPIVVLVDIHCKFEHQIFYPADLVVKTKVVRLKNSSFEFYCEIWNKDKRCAKSTAIMVWLDDETHRPCKIPKWFSQAVMEKENLNDAS